MERHRTDPSLENPGLGGCVQGDRQPVVSNGWRRLALLAVRSPAQASRPVRSLSDMPALAAPLARAKDALQKEVDAWRSRETEQDRARSGRFE
jgi:hypothetical protein